MPVTTLIVASALVCGVATYTTDSALMDAVQRNRFHGTGRVAAFARGFGDGRWTLCGASAVLAGGYLFQHERTARAGRYAVEALVIADVMTGVAKVAGHRHRPHRGNGPYAWDGPSTATDDGRLSFFSGHTANAFALAGVAREVYGDVPGVTPAAYTLAVLTGWSRMHDRMHWASDVVVGALAGWGGVQLAVRLDRKLPARWRLEPAPGGVALSARW